MSGATVWALAIDNDGGTGLTVHATEALAMQSLIRYCEEWIEGFELDTDVDTILQQCSISEQMSNQNSQWFVLSKCEIEQEIEA